VPKGDSSFAVVDKRVRAFDGRFHLHPEIEITLIERSSGRRVVGDNVDSFAPGDLVLLGENLPHQYVSDAASDDTLAVAKVIQFRPDLLAENLLRLPEFKRIAALLKQSARGRRFGDETVKKARHFIARIFTVTGPKRMLLLMELLDVLSRDSLSTPIESAGYVSRISTREGDTIDRALHYLNANFTEAVTLKDVCRHLHVSPATCNRLFRKSIGRSFKTALIEVRISHACRLLLETDQPIVEVAASSGFTNLSNFNRHFKELKRHTPRAFRNLLSR